MGTSTRVLKVFVSRGCRGCKKAEELAKWVQGAAPWLGVQVIDLAAEPDSGRQFVFGVPTYMFGDETIFLGNPSQTELQVWLDQLESEG